MKILKYISIFILSIFLLISCCFIQLSFSMDKTIFNTSFYSSLINNHKLHEIPQNYVLLKAKHNSNKIDEQVYRWLVNAVEETFDEAWSEEQVNTLLNSFLGYLKSKNTNLDLVIDFREEKSDLKTLMLAEAAKREDKSISDDYYIHQIDFLCESSELPDLLDLRYTEFLATPEILKSIELMRHYYPYMIYLPWLLFAVSFFLLVLATRFKKALQSTGFIMALSGLVLILLCSSFSAKLDSSIITLLSDKDGLLASIGTNPMIIATVFKNSVFSFINRISIIFTVVGFIIACASYLIKHKQVKPDLNDKFLMTVESD